jgi:hypothetical protein
MKQSSCQVGQVMPFILQFSDEKFSIVIWGDIYKTSYDNLTIILKAWVP